MAKPPAGHTDRDSMILYLLELVIFNDPVKGCYRKGNWADWKLLPPSKSLFNFPMGCGLPIGNLTFQLFSNIYLSCLDDYVKRDLKCEHYGRYVDDFYIVDVSPKKLLQIVPLIRTFLKDRLSLALHPHKVNVFSAHKGVPFLGAIVKPYQRYVSHRTRRNIGSRLPEIMSKEENPFLISASVQSYIGYMKHFSR